MSAAGRLPLLAVLFSLVWTGLAYAVTVEVEVQSQGEPVPNAEISFQTPEGKEIAFSDAAKAEGPETPPAAPEAPGPPVATPSAPDQRPPSITKVTPEAPATGPAAPLAPQQPEAPPTPRIAKIASDENGKVAVEIDDELRDQPVIVVIRRDGKIIAREQITLTGDPVRVAVSVPLVAEPVRTALQPPQPPQITPVPQPVPPAAEPVAETGSPFSFSVAPHVGVLDTGRANLPVRLQSVGLGAPAGAVTRIFEVDRDDQTASGVTGEVHLALPGGGSALYLGASYISSDDDFLSPAVPLAGSGVAFVLPQGGIQVIGAAAPLTGLFYSSKYDEFTLTPGVAFPQIALGAGDATVRPRVGGVYGETTEKSTTRFTAGAFTGVSSDKVETERVGGFIGAEIRVPVTDNLSLVGDGELRFVNSDASGRVLATGTVGPCAGGCAAVTGDGRSSLEFRLRGDAALQITRQARASLEVGYESWEVPVRSHAAGSAIPAPVSIDWEDRHSLTVGARLSIDLQ